MKNRLDIIEALERARKAQGLTQEGLAVRAGTSRVTVGRVEAGFDPKLATVYELARALGLELALVPKALAGEVQAFIRSGGRVLGQPSGASAPPSVVEQASVAKAPRLSEYQVLAAGGLPRSSATDAEIPSEVIRGPVWSARSVAQAASNGPSLNAAQSESVWSAQSVAKAFGSGPTISPAAIAKLHGVKITGNKPGSGG